MLVVITIKTNCECVTFFTPFVTDDRNTDYRKEVVENVYRTACIGEKSSINTKSALQKREVFISIPAESVAEFIPNVGDYMAIGNVPFPDDRSQLLKVKSVTDCRYGSRNVQHIEVVAN